MSVHGSNGGGPTGDSALAAAFVAGDAAAFSALYERYVSRIYDFVRRTVRDQAAAEDLTQATFLQAYERRATLRDPAAVRAWLYRIAHNAAINHVTRSRMADELDELSAPPSTKPGPEEVAVQRESADLVWDAAASLEPRQYAVLDLTVRKGLTNAEVAEVLGVDAAQASVAVFRAREALGNAVRFLLVARRRRHCDRLADLVPEGVRQLTAAQRASVDRHLRRCPTCQRMAMALTAPDQLFAALPLLAVPAALRHAPQIVPTAVATGLPPAGGPRLGGHLARNLVAGTAIGAVIAAAIVAGVVVTRNPPTRTPPTRAPVAAGPTVRPAAAATTLKTFEPWVRNVPSGEAAPRPGLVVTNAGGTCDQGTVADPGRPEAFRCLDDRNNLIDACFAPTPPLQLPGPAVLCSTDPTSPQVELLSPAQPLPAGRNSDDPSAAPWFLVLADGRKCARAASGSDTAVLGYFCKGGTLVTAPDRSQPAWTVRQGTFVNASPVLSPGRIVVTVAYR